MPQTPASDATLSALVSFPPARHPITPNADTSTFLQFPALKTARTGEAAVARRRCFVEPWRSIAGAALSVSLHLGVLGMFLLTLCPLVSRLYVLWSLNSLDSAYSRLLSSVLSSVAFPGFSFASPLFV